MSKKRNPPSLKLRRTRKNNKLSIFRIFFSVVVVLILVSLIYPFLSKKTFPCANSRSCKESFNLKIENNTVGIFNNQKVIVPNISLNETKSKVLGSKISLGEKHIYVDLKTQTLTAYEGDKLFMRTPISSGLWGKTPTGEFNIWVKLRATRMSGGAGDDYYDLPNVPYVMFFSNDEVPSSAGFSLHGTYWHNNFGHAMSHGCVNMKTTDVAKLFEWAENKTKITIFDEIQT